MPNPVLPPVAPESPTQPKTRNKVLIGVISSLILIAVGSLTAIYLVRTSPPQGGVEGRSLLASPASPAPVTTPFPFEEMTIPALRARNYKSNLGDRQIVSATGSYTSYLTNYDSDGFKVNGLLTIPKGTVPEGGWPAIIFIHGYIPPNQYQTLTRYVDHVDYLARNGFAVFKIDLRGHGNSEGEAGGGYFSADYVTDVLNAHTALQGLDLINKNKIGLWGHSMAGNIALRSMASRPGIPVSVIWGGAVYTYIDMQEYGIQDNSYQPQPTDSERQRKRQQLRELYGNPTENHWFWKLVAPSNYLSDLKGAVQLNHAVNDEVVSVEYSRNLSKLMDQAKVPYELNELPSGGHNITGESFTTAMQNTVRFFKEHFD